jgi:predicted aconitase
MTEISGASALSMSSLYALMGQAMPSGVPAASTDGAASNPALAMMAAANASAGMQVMTLLASMGTPGSAAAASGGDAAVFRAASLSEALAGLSYLDPAKELEMLGFDLPASSAGAASG